MSREWDKENMKTLGVRLKKETAEKFQAYAESQGVTVGSLLRAFVESTVSDRPAPVTPPPGTGQGGYWHLVTYAKEDKLKHEAAFHNPGSLNPAEMLDYILNDYFRIAKHFRRKSSEE